MAFKTTQLLAAAMLLSMAVAAMAGRQDAPQAELEAKKKYGHKDDYHKEEYHAPKEEYHASGEYYPPAGEYYPPAGGPTYPKPHEYHPSPAYPPHYGPAPAPYPSHDYYPHAATPSKCKCKDVNEALELCGMECLNTMMNINACGSCMTKCAVGAECKAGKCMCPKMTQVVCDGACVEKSTFDSDPKNCGECGEVCGEGDNAGKPFCKKGKCKKCPDDKPDYCEATNTCVDLSDDKNNCGCCGKECTGEDVCVDSICQPPCKADGIECEKKDNDCCLGLECKNVNAGDDGRAATFTCQKKCLAAGEECTGNGGCCSKNCDKTTKKCK